MTLNFTYLCHSFGLTDNLVISEMVLLQLMDFVKPGIVDWKKRVNTKEKMAKEKMKAKKYQQILENCNYAVELGKKLNLVLVGIGG